MKTGAPTKNALLLLAAVASVAVLAQPARAQDSFMDQIRSGDYKGLAKKLKASVDLKHADPDLRWYLDANIKYLERGAKPKKGGEYVILVRGTRNDKAFKSEPASGGDRVYLPNSIRFQRKSWDERLDRFEGYFREATTAMGGDGAKLSELAKIIDHHRGGGLGKTSNSVKSVLISASTRALPTFGPPFEVIKIPAERVIFNYKGLSGEAEVLIPFWILPSEIIAHASTMAEVEALPEYQASKLKGLQPRSYTGGTTVDNWAIIEANVRNGRPMLEGVAGLNCALEAVGPDATKADVEKFIADVLAKGGAVERVAKGDPRLPEGALARTILVDGKPVILIPADRPVKTLALAEEATHVGQLVAEIAKSGIDAVEDLLRKAAEGEKKAVLQIFAWELEAKEKLLAMLSPKDAARPEVERAIKDLERGPRFPATVRDLSRLTIPELRRQYRGELPEGQVLTKAFLISELTGTEVSQVERELATIQVETVRGATVRDRFGRELDKDKVKTTGVVGELARDRVTEAKTRIR